MLEINFTPEAIMSAEVVFVASRPNPEIVMMGMFSWVLAVSARLNPRCPFKSSSLLPPMIPRREILIKPQPAQVIPLGLAMIKSALLPAIST